VAGTAQLTRPPMLEGFALRAHSSRNAPVAVASSGRANRKP
jgi:hypothetical protein